MSNESYTEQDGSQASNDNEISDIKSSLSEKQKEREALNKQMEAFLANGGNIHHIERDVLADPPKKPKSNYGGQPI